MKPDDELLAAYVDGVGELTPDERRGVEARLEDPALRVEQAEVRGLIDQLRALPAEGAEPDWAALERSIRAAVGTSVPRPWWQRWTWLAPISTFATAAIVLLLVWGRPPAMTTWVMPELPRQVAPAPREPEAFALWLDGDVLDVDPSALEALAPPDAVDDDAVGLLPASDLAWVDKLDDDAMDRAERWLASQPRG